MEASVSVGPPPRERAAQHRLLRLGTDDQLVALFRKGFDEAFDTIHDRYRPLMFAYTRQMLGYSNADAEDAVQEVFIRASHSLRRDDRQVMLRAWLYRIAHNYCVDLIRRPAVPLCDLYDVSRPPCRDPAVEVEQRESIRRLVTDMERLPEQQRSALLMQIDGLRYVEIAAALGISVFAVKSGLNRARDNLKAAHEAREAACADIRADIDRAHGRKVRMSGRSRRHLSDCTACATYKADLRRADRSLNALFPDAGILTWVLKLLGIGGAGGSGVAAGGGAAVGGGTVAATVSVGAGPIAAKVGALVCCAVLTGVAAGDRSGDPGAPTANNGTRPGAQAHASPGDRPDHTTMPGAVDPRTLPAAGPARPAAPRHRARPHAVAPPVPAAAATSPLVSPKRGAIETHRATPSPPTNYKDTADAAHQAGGAAAPDDDDSATTTDPPARDEPTPNGTPPDADRAAGPNESAPVVPETNPKPQTPAASASPAPVASQTPVAGAGATATTPSSPAPATPSESGGGTSATEAATSAPAVPDIAGAAGRYRRAPPWTALPSPSSTRSSSCAAAPARGSSASSPSTRRSAARASAAVACGATTTAPRASPTRSASRGR